MIVFHIYYVPGLPATKIRRFFETLTGLYPELLDGPFKGIPAESTIQALRDDVPKLNRIQVTDFVDKATSLTVCVDQR